MHSRLTWQASFVSHALGGGNGPREAAISELVDEGYLISVTTTPEERKACGKKVLLKRTDKPFPMFELEV